MVFGRTCYVVNNIIYLFNYVLVKNKKINKNNVIVINKIVP